MFKRTQVCTGLMLAFGGALAISAFPALAQQSLPRVEITGSAIKRVAAEGPAPVEIYNRKDIERTGATSIAELVKNIAALDIDDQGELTGNSPSGSGSTNLQIRGLSERNLLVLLNGRRLPVNALHDGSGAGAAVDVNNIPISAIERIEVLKDGGSAIYGADAVAGVINFITRKNYTGLEARLGLGISSRRDAVETPAGLVFGVGDFDTQGFNVLAAFDVLKRDPLMRTARDITKSADWRRFAGGAGADGRSGFHPNVNIRDGGPSGTVIGQLVPCPATDLRGTTCRFDFNKSVLTSINGADRFSGMVVGNLKLSSNTTLFGEVTYSESKDKFEAQPAPGNYVADNRDTPEEPLDDIVWSMRPMQFGPRTTNRKSTLLLGTVGATGTIGTIDWDVALGQGVSKVSNKDSNYAASDALYAAIDAGTFDPSSTSNPQSVVDALKITPQRDGKSVNRFVNAKMSGQVMELAGGPLAYAIGLSAVRETLDDEPDANQQIGNVFGSIAQAAVSASRTSKAIFGELSIPIFKGLETQVALRHDRYPGNSKTSPKLAAKYSPFGGLAVRASYAESFLAPSLKQLYGGLESGAQSTDDPEICAYFGVAAVDCDRVSYIRVSGSNPNLKPETGKTINLGVVFEPVANVGISVDAWQIKKKDEIGELSDLSALAVGDFGIFLGDQAVFTANKNIAATKVSGVDLDIRGRIGDTPFGRMSIRDTATYYLTQKTQFEPGDVFYEYLGSWLSPRWRNTLAVNFDQGPWSTTFTLRTTASMKDTLSPTGFQGNARRIAAHEELDVGFSYTGVKNLTFNGIVKNVLDSAPPYANNGTTNGYGSMGFPWLYSPRGRYFSFSANYKFF